MKSLVHQLRRWQFREWLYRAAWGAARWFALVAGVLFLCCFADWFIDRFRDTPLWLRILMTGGQVVLYSLAAFFLLCRLHVPRIDVLAGRAEAAIPEFDHRLVTALQLNRRGARTDGMSHELIAAVTREAETMSNRHNLVGLAEHNRLRNAAALLVPVILIGGGLLLLRPALCSALLARQALFGVDIPRSIKLDNATPPLWPSGDAVVLRFNVSGRIDESAVGSVRVEPEGQPRETYPLAFEGRADDGTATFAAKVPPSSAPFSFRAWLQDGRTRSPAAVRFEPRPVVEDIAALILLPEYVGRTPDGRRFTRFQPHGEIVTLPGCDIRVAATVQKHIADATLVVLGKGSPGETLARLPMKIAEDELSAEITFGLPNGAGSYRIEVKDHNGFANLNPPRRGITFAADDPPRVALLTEVLKDPREPGPLDDYEVNGMPLVLGGQVQIGYTARSPIGLDRAFIMYRVNEGDWTPLPLAKTVADPAKVGRFIPELGVFENSGPFGQVEFYPLPPPSPDEPAGLEAGGRYSFQTAALTKKGPGGAETKLEVGDRVEFYVEVYDRNPAAGRPPGKSESRLKAVVTQSQLEEWTRQRDQSRERLRQIEERQRGVFKPAAGN